MQRFAKSLFDENRALSEFKENNQVVILKNPQCPIFNYVVSLNSDASKATVKRVNHD